MPQNGSDPTLLWPASSLAFRAESRIREAPAQLGTQATAIQHFLRLRCLATVHHIWKGGTAARNVVACRVKRRPLLPNAPRGTAQARPLETCSGREPEFVRSRGGRSRHRRPAGTRRRDMTGLGRSLNPEHWAEGQEGDFHSLGAAGSECLDRQRTQARQGGGGDAAPRFNPNQRLIPTLPI